ncbi:hypothetical protein OG410_00645 [Streptomyces sp. NBC_00659]|uniref:hypothetical protein n=1 Tax=Streptomyces sp. NBC_00659 TaxID=2903669 RepID=UPI002E37BBE4|nr:hypothetical protein [Streptomyces sp. NBC_00659]
MSSDPDDGVPTRHQPRWAWWVVGIAVPLLGIVVTLLATAISRSSTDAGALANPSASSMSGTRGSDGAASAAATVTESSSASSSEPARVEYGPAVFSMEASYDPRDADLDSGPPLLVTRGSKGADLYLDSTLAQPVAVFDGWGEVSLGQLPAGDAAPTEAECTDRIENNTTSEIDLARGVRFCLRTDQGRTAYLRVISAPLEEEGKVRFEVTVWDLPEE